tara:strand:+ start:152 stop:475 length:324 start_codon:yes stop_codon:yes gene_type:complete
MIKYEVKVYPNGHKEWFLNGNFHREDGPAVEYPHGTKIWYLNDKLHREDGPAVESANGNKEWFLNGKPMSEDEHKRATSKATCEGKEVEVDGVTYVLKVKGEQQRKQ